MESSASIAIVEITEGPTWRGVTVHTGVADILAKSIELAKATGLNPGKVDGFGRFKILPIDVGPEDCPIGKSALWPFLEQLQHYLDGLPNLAELKLYQWMYNRSGDRLASVTGQGGDRGK